jgi:hypothetical protein
MPETVRVIRAGSHPVYEVVKSEDGLTVTIRSAENHEEKIDLMSSVVGTLINVLQEFR